MGQQTLGPEDTRVQVYEDYAHNERHVTQIVHRIYIAMSKLVSKAISRTCTCILHEY